MTEYSRDDPRQFPVGSQVVWLTEYGNFHTTVLRHSATRVQIGGGDLRGRPRWVTAKSLVFEVPS